MILLWERLKTSRAGLRFDCSPACRLNEGLELVLGCMISGETIGTSRLEQGVLGGFGRFLAGGLALAFGGFVCFGILVQRGSVWRAW